MHHRADFANSGERRSDGSLLGKSRLIVGNVEVRALEEGVDRLLELALGTLHGFDEMRLRAVARKLLRRSCSPLRAPDSSKRTRSTSAMCSSFTAPSVGVRGDACVARARRASPLRTGVAVTSRRVRRRARRARPGPARPPGRRPRPAPASPRSRGSRQVARPPRDFRGGPRSASSRARAPGRE